MRVACHQCLNEQIRDEMFNGSSEQDLCGSRTLSGNLKMCYCMRSRSQFGRRHFILFGFCLE